MKTEHRTCFNRSLTRTGAVDFVIVVVVADVDVASVIDVFMLLNVVALYIYRNCVLH